MEPTVPTALRRQLFRLDNVCVRVAEGGTLGPMSWTLERGRRLGVRCAKPAQWDALVGLLSGEQPPLEGRLEEISTVSVQTDDRLRENLSPNLILHDYLQTPDVPEFVWLDGRRRSLMVLVDLLGISPAMTRRAMKYGPTELPDKVWALRFMLSKAELLIGRALFATPEPLVREALRRRWGDLPGAVLACAEAVPLPADPDGWIVFDAQGRCTGPTPPHGAAGRAGAP